jgi:hypothetical protein
MFLTGIVFLEFEYEFCLGNLIFQAAGPLIAFLCTNTPEMQRIFGFFPLNKLIGTDSSLHTLFNLRYLVTLNVLVLYVFHLEEVARFLTMRGGRIFVPVLFSPENSSLHTNDRDEDF